MTGRQGSREDWDAVQPAASRRLRLFLALVPLVTIGFFVALVAVLR